MRVIASLRHVLVKAGAGPRSAVSFIQTVASERCNKYHSDRQQNSKMASTAPLFLRLVSNSVCVAHRAGRLIRDILSKGELGIIEKVSTLFLVLTYSKTLSDELLIILVINVIAHFESTFSILHVRLILSSCTF